MGFCRREIGIPETAAPEEAVNLRFRQQADSDFKFRIGLIGFNWTGTGIEIDGQDGQDRRDGKNAKEAGRCGYI